MSSPRVQLGPNGSIIDEEQARVYRKALKNLRDQAELLQDMTARLKFKTLYFNARNVVEICDNSLIWFDGNARYLKDDERSDNE